MRHVLVGFGFGPIQAGLFVEEAYRSRNFSRLVVAEIDPDLVEAVRRHQGCYYVNIAGASGVEVRQIEGVEMLNPRILGDRERLVQALEETTEIVTSLPSVSFYSQGGPNSVAGLIGQSLPSRRAEATVVYTAENNNHAAEVLQRDVADFAAGTSLGRPVQYLNTVIGKMSQVITDPQEITQLGLTPIAPGMNRAFLVESFNRILVTRTTLANFAPGIDVFIEKDDLLPFEEAKLYGHNAIHALLAFLGRLRGYRKMTELKDDASLMAVARRAFLEESGAALVKKYASLQDGLFTPAGYQAYADDLLERMTNPYLVDAVGRAARDPVRKLAYTDRIFGTMVLALEHGITPAAMALGAMAGLGALLDQADECQLPEALRYGRWQDLNSDQIEKLLRWVWQDVTGKHQRDLIALVQQAQGRLQEALQS